MPNASLKLCCYGIPLERNPSLTGSHQLKTAPENSSEKHPRNKFPTRKDITSQLRIQKKPSEETDQPNRTLTLRNRGAQHVTLHCTPDPNSGNLPKDDRWSGSLAQLVESPVLGPVGTGFDPRQGQQDLLTSKLQHALQELFVAY